MYTVLIKNKLFGQKADNFQFKLEKRFVTFNTIV